MAEASPASAVVLLSGGMDSCVTLALAIEQGFSIAALHVQYGQRTEQREREAFTNICNHYSIATRLVVNISHLAAIGGSSLTDTSMPVTAHISTNSTIPTSYVPFRNANILAIATSWAEVIGARALFIGAVEEDSSGYPDCTQSFFDAFQRVLTLGTKPSTSIQLCTPVIHQSKAAIIKEGMRLKAPLHLSWSCYQQTVTACGVCDSCVLRLKGFQGAGIDDPIKYA
jgi:7-cyano-7-deazaguanine synthase